MERNELVELVLARVVEKLAQRGVCEAQPQCACESADDGRPGLLVLTQEHGETCHCILEDPDIRARYRTECALLHDYQVDLDRFEVVVIYQLTNDVLCKLASGLCDTPFTKLAQQAILSGKRVFVPTEELEVMLSACKLPAPYYAMLQEKLAMLTACGLMIRSQQNLAGAILDSGCCACAEPAAPAAELAPAPVPAAATKELCLNKRVITERDVTAADAEKVTCIHIGEKSILTALAAEYAKSKGIRLVRDAGR